ncbi:thioesterase family protein [Chryseobacterium sp. ISL-6]|uniref:acyl-CoA thioesterase n=1 Tax=Chryseobacterium sp. ISL-6 TaxID=2819143 RepID=UPI001BEA1BF8|nr:thioesterase family protein [Chryseobacterium sp. ISL-6]MBT2623692.1 acyl-CoA thioesterase [Chryseobacterium sp. ISL-6]
MRELTYRGVVYPWHCDHMGHMNVMWYAGKFDEATWNLLSLFGLTVKYMKQENTGTVAAEQRTFYKQELLAGMTVYIKSGIIEVKDKSIKFFHEMRNCDTDEIAAITFYTGIYIDNKERKPCSIPEEIKKLAADFVTSEIPQP